MPELQGTLLPQGGGWGGALEENPKDRVAIPPASPAVVGRKHLPRGHCPGASFGPRAWSLAVPASPARGVGAVSGGKDTQARRRAGAGSRWPGSLSSQLGVRRVGSVRPTTVGTVTPQTGKGRKSGLSFRESLL